MPLVYCRKWGEPDTLHTIDCAIVEGAPDRYVADYVRTVAGSVTDAGLSALASANGAAQKAHAKSTGA